MSREPLIVVENVSKKFCFTLKRSMLYGIVDTIHDVIGISNNRKELRADEFWALKDITFKVHRGECLGIIGQNGAGKSTLLRLLNGIILPDSGRIKLFGTVGGLLEVGAGFHPMLTGRENIYINGSILGMTKKEIDQMLDDIVSFAELEKFIDTPVKHYSSGMYVRLGFAIAAQIKPDILLIDEVLAVGDVGFKAKCYAVISELLKTSAVVFVSHSMPEIARLCSKILFLDRGRSMYIGHDVFKGIDMYNRLSPKPEGITVETDDGAFEEILLKAETERDGIPCVRFSEDLDILIRARLKKTVQNPIVHVAILNQGYQNICHISSHYSKAEIRNKNGRLGAKVTLESLCLRPGKYYLDFAITDRDNVKIIARTHLCHHIQVTGEFSGYGAILAPGKWENL